MNFNVSWAAISDGLVAYYPFNGNANDASGNGYNGAVNGATLVADRFGKANNAYSFNGISDYIAIPEFLSVDISAVTITAWIRPNLVHDGAIYYKAQQGEMMLRTSSGAYDLGVNLAEGGWFWTSGGSVSTKRFQHIAAIYNRGKWIEIWIDGVFASRMNISDQNLTGGVLSSSIGSYNQSSAGVFNGTIDEVAVYNRALSESEIKALCKDIPHGLPWLMLLLDR